MDNIDMGISAKNSFLYSFFKPITRIRTTINGKIEYLISSPNPRSNEANK